MINPPAYSLNHKPCETVTMLARPDRWLEINSCSTPAAPLCQTISACFYIWRLSRTFLCYCSGSNHCYSTWGAQKDILRQVHVHTNTQLPNDTHTPYCPCLFSPARSVFLFPASRKMRSLHSWRLLLLTEQMGQRRQLVHHAVTVATYSWARCIKTTRAFPNGFPHLILCSHL